MTALSQEALDILRATVASSLRRNKYRGSINAWTAAHRSGGLVELLDAGLMADSGEIRPGTRLYYATSAGMRAAGLSPREIERCCALRPETRP